MNTIHRNILFLRIKFNCKHVARHSWVTITKRGGIFTSVISERHGHATEHITQVYLDNFESSVIDDANDRIMNLD